MLAPLGSTVLASGCTKDCTLLGVYEGLIVGIEDPAGFADGTYELVLEADGVEVSLVVELADDGAATCVPAEGQTACAAEASVGDGLRLHASIVESYVSGITLNLYYVDVERDDLAGGPAVARVRVVHDGETIGDQTFEPEYERDEPNGEGCGVATRAQVELTL